MRLSGRVCKMTCLLGISSFVTQLVGCVMQIVMNNVLVYYGNQTAVGRRYGSFGDGIVLKIAMILASACIGIGIARSLSLGSTKGPKQTKRIKKPL